MVPDVIGADEGVTFGSAQWLELARRVLETLVAEHGEDGRSFSACEVFTDAPDGLMGADDHTAGWHFVIDGKTVTVGEGAIEGADMSVRVPYRRALPMARRAVPSFGIMVYGVLCRLIRRPAPPVYLADLHNQLARVTR